MIDEWVKWRVANPIDPAPYQAQLAIGLSLIAESAAFEKRLPRLNNPTLILFGAHDKVVPPENADLLAKQIANSKIVIFPDAGHFFPIEIPEAASRAIVEFAGYEVVSQRKIVVIVDIQPTQIFSGGATP